MWLTRDWLPSGQKKKTWEEGGGPDWAWITATGSGWWLSAESRQQKKKTANVMRGRTITVLQHREVLPALLANWITDGILSGMKNFTWTQSTLKPRLVFKPAAQVSQDPLSTHMELVQIRFMYFCALYAILTEVTDFILTIQTISTKNYRVQNPKSWFPARAKK